MAGNTEKETERKIDWHEIRRKTFHIIGGLIFAATIYFDIAQAWMVLLLLGLGLILSVIYTSYDIPLVDFFLKRFEREHLRKKFPGKGVIYLFMAVFFMMIAFEKNIVLAGLMIWTFGDSISAIVGKHYGNVKHPLNERRLLEGTIAGIICGTIASAYFLDWNWLYALIASTVSMTIESLDWELYREAFDDNFFVPVIGAFVIQALIWIF
ncbi:MAG TPA: SEC59/DGK1/VTE5 family protein [Alphaproteobacteria bacterium]|nr:SEC59/DGK1/VTE5 family protein [Alphaproteobacteria bacterium]